MQLAKIGIFPSLLQAVQPLEAQEKIHPSLMAGPVPRLLLIRGQRSHDNDGVSSHSKDGDSSCPHGTLALAFRIRLCTEANPLSFLQISKTAALDGTEVHKDI